MDKTNYIEASLRQQYGQLSKDGALIVKTGASTGRSTKERFIVQHEEISDQIAWGSVNQPISPAIADSFFAALKSKVLKNEHHSTHGFVGCFDIEVTSNSPWHVAFAKNMFRQNFISEVQCQIPEKVKIEVWHDPNGQFSELGLKVEFPFEKAIILDLVHRRVGIIGTAYAGEIKKSAFSLCNFLLPQYGIFPMHASANCLEDGSESCVLFGLSGTGKTTLSADPERFLIGDDEIVWSPTGISNLEGGCYAKLINLKEKQEPEIFRAANHFGSILENVSFNEATREIDFADGSITENTRGSYSLDALARVYDQSRQAQPPRSIVFLVADAFGALPALARLNPWQAQYHFISGYTAKVAGTEIGITEPQATFSPCFGAPFMPRPANVYAGLLGELAEKNQVSIWILNTGWFGGGYGQGERFPIPVSRQLLNAIQTGALDSAPTIKHPIFGFEIPKEAPRIESHWLQIPNGAQVMALAQKFIANAEKNKAAFTPQIIELGGPRILS